MEAIADFLHNVFPVHMFYAIQLLIVELLFIVTQKKRSRPVIRVLISTVFFLLLSFFFPLPGYWFIRVLAIFLMSMFYLFFCLDNSFTCCVFIAITSYAVQNLAYNLGGLIVGLSPIVRHSFIFYVVTAIVFTVVYIASWFLVVKRMRNDGKISINNIGLFVLSVATTIAVLLKNVFSSLNLMDEGNLAVLYAAISCVLIIVVQQGAMERGTLKEQNKIIEQLLKSDNNRMNALKENMDIINMKCHDLRYHINEYRKSVNASEHDKFFEEIEKSVDVYDNIAHTGNAALDVVLSDRLLFCNANGIEVSYIVNDEVLKGMEVSDIYSLFGNAIDNAVSSVRFAEKDRRIISLTVRRKDDCGHIIISNYCETPPAMQDGMPVPSGDTTYHGFGVKSMKYIVEKYGGNMVFDYGDNIFTLSILLPNLKNATDDRLQISQE